MNRRERRAAASKAKDTPKVPAARVDAALYRTVLDHLNGGRHLDAQLCCQKILEANPDHAETLHLMALVCFNARQFDHAAEWASRAVGQDPKPGYLNTLGTILLNLGRHEEALKAFDQTVRLRPDDAGVWATHGNALVEAGRAADAIDSFERAIEIDPRHLDATFKLGVLLQQAERLEESLVYFDRCEALLPGQAGTLTIRAVALLGLDRFEEALRDSLRAHALDPENAYIRKNIGHTLIRLGRAEEALDWLDGAMARRPDFVDALGTKAEALAELHRFDEAVALYRAALAIDPSHAATKWKFGLLQMLLGDFDAGWLNREARFDLPSGPGPRPDLPRPLWLGKESVARKTMLIYSDEGLGDSIQFARYIPLLAARGARIILAVEEPIRALLSGVAGVVACLPKPIHSAPDFDLYCPMCSLPLAFGTRLDTIPPAKSYLPPPAAHRVQTWAKRLGARDRLRVGLVWSGSSLHKNDYRRSMPARALSRLLDVDAMFVSLQKEPRPEDAAFLAGRTDIVDLTEHLTDFSDTAALISCLDLVITVDTSVAHLAAALGLPTWIMLPYMPDYRWLLDRDDSPWYPTVRLFRQDETCDYARVVDRLRAELVELTSRRAAP